MITFYRYIIPDQFILIPFILVIILPLFSWIMNNRKRALDQEYRADLHRAIVSNNKPIFTNMYTTLLRSIVGQEQEQYKFFTNTYYDILHNGNSEFLQYFMKEHNAERIFGTHLYDPSFLRLLNDTNIIKQKDPLLDNMIIGALTYIDFDAPAHYHFFIDILESGSTRLIKYYWNTSENKTRCFNSKNNKIECLETILANGNEEVFDYLVNDNSYNNLMDNKEFENYCLENRDIMKVLFCSFNYQMYKITTSKLKSLNLSPALFEAYVDIVIEREADEYHDLMNIIMKMLNDCCNDYSGNQVNLMKINQCMVRLFNYTDTVVLMGDGFKQQLIQQIKEQQNNFYNAFNHYW